MKKIFLLLITIISIGCEKEEIIESNEKIVGVWQWKARILSGEVEDYENAHYSNVQEFKFYADNSYESLMYFLNEDDDKIEGYHSKETGSYEIINDTIYRRYDQYYSNKTSEYEVVPLQDLKLFQRDIEFYHYFRLENDESVLIFNFDFERLNPVLERKFIRIN